MISGINYCIIHKLYNNSENELRLHTKIVMNLRNIVLREEAET